MPNALSAYFQFAKLSFREGLKSKADWLGRIGFYFVILLIFSFLWKATFEIGFDLGISQTEMIWYLAITEWIVLAIPMTHLEIENDFHTGALAYFLIRPKSYVMSKVFEGIGILVLRLLMMGVAGFFFALFLSGSLPSQVSSLIWVFPLGIVSAVTLLVFNNCIGVSAYWIQSSTPIYWVWQKLTFILGGLILPLSIYPQWLQEIAHLTPFSALLNQPASLIFEFSHEAWIFIFFKILFWLLFALVLLEVLFQKARKTIEVSGG